MRSKYRFIKPDEHEAVLPILIVRDPYFWCAPRDSPIEMVLWVHIVFSDSVLFVLTGRFNSMCESPYLMKWPHSKQACPNLVRDLDQDEGFPASTRWGKEYERTWESLAHVWSEFNGEYQKADFPRIIIRFEGACRRCNDG